MSVLEGEKGKLGHTDLVEAEGKAFVGKDVGFYYFGDFFFVGWGEEEA